jgi:ubiquinol-cytochrome c reductase cytochrome b subunit
VPGKLVDPKTYKKEYEELLHKDGVPFWPDAAWRDVVFGVLVVGGIILLAAILGPPALDKPPDPSLTDASPRPDWYLLWYFAVLSLMPANLETALILGAPLLVGGLLFSAPFLSNRGERSARRRPWAVAMVVVTVLMIGSLWIVGAESDWSPNFKAEPLSAEIVGTTTGPVAAGAVLFHDKGCINCHLIEGQGGRRGPNLSRIGDLLTHDEIVIRISNGGRNMPGFAAILKPEELEELVAFLQSRKAPAAK